MAEITGGELLLKCLHAENVRYVHAITDGTYMMFLEALERLGGEYDMELIVPRHEAAAVHFAEAYARVTSGPAVVMACAGPGAANLLSGLICAQAEGNPVIAITTTRRSDIGDSYVHQAGMQVGNQHDYFKAAVKWSGKVDHWQRIPDMVRHAFRMAMAGRPGPVHLLVPQDVLDRYGERDSVEIYPPEKYRASAMTRGAADPDLVREAAELLVGSDLVNLHAGNGAERGGAGGAVTALAEYLGMPLTTSSRAQGLMPSSHPMALHMASPGSRLAHAESDTLLVIGTRLGELVGFGKAPIWGDPATTKTIQIDIEATNIGLNRPVDIALVGDAKVVAEQLLAEIKTLVDPRAPHSKIAEYRGYQDQWRAGLDSIVAGYGEAMCVGTLVKTCDEFFDEQSILTVDGGNTQWWTLNAHFAQAERATISSGQFGHLGSGFPYAIGAKLAAPDKTVYCITGDSAFAFNLQELETAVREKLPVVVLVSVDGAWGMEKTAQARTWGREAPWFCIEHSPVRYDKVCEAMGGHGEYVAKASELVPALARAVASGKPAVLHCVIEPESNIQPPGIEVWNALRAGKAAELLAQQA
jgi:acetolactate synthase I/II/III large subunit